jgi:hypothetical protein
VVSHWIPALTCAFSAVAFAIGRRPFLAIVMTIAATLWAVSP